MFCCNHKSTTNAVIASRPQGSQPASPIQEPQNPDPIRDKSQKSQLSRLVAAISTPAPSDAGIHPNDHHEEIRSINSSFTNKNDDLPPGFSFFNEIIDQSEHSSVRSIGSATVSDSKDPHCSQLLVCLENLKSHFDQIGDGTIDGNIIDEAYFAIKGLEKFNFLDRSEIIDTEILSNETHINLLKDILNKWVDINKANNESDQGGANNLDTVIIALHQLKIVDYEAKEVCKPNPEKYSIEVHLEKIATRDGGRLSDTDYEKWGGKKRFVLMKQYLFRSFESKMGQPVTLDTRIYRACQEEFTERDDQNKLFLKGNKESQGKIHDPYGHENNQYIEPSSRGWTLNAAMIKGGADSYASDGKYRLYSFSLRDVLDQQGEIFGSRIAIIASPCLIVSLPSGKIPARLET